MAVKKKSETISTLPLRVISVLLSLEQSAIVVKRLRMSTSCCWALKGKRRKVVEEEWWWIGPGDDEWRMVWAIRLEPMVARRDDR
jgi:hypothetical protein